MEMQKDGRTIYIGCALSGEIHVAKISESGELSAYQKVKLTMLDEVGGAMPIALSHNVEKLYAVSRGEPFFISSFDVQKDGGLKPDSNVLVDENIAFLKALPSDRYLFSASFIDHQVSVYEIYPTRKIGRVTQRIKPIQHAHAISLAPDRHTVIATGLGEDRIYQWQWQEEKLVEIHQLDLMVGTGPRHIAFHPRHPLAYVIGEKNGSVSVLRYDRKGLKLVQTVYMPEMEKPFQSADIHVTASGRFLYTSEKCASELHLFIVDERGMLRHAEVFSTEERPRGFFISSDDKYLIAAGQHSHHISSYSIDDKSGRLEFVDRLPVGMSPDWVEVV